MMRMIWSRLSIVAVLWLVVGQAPARAQRDPQSQYEPRSKPGAGQKLLEKFVGDWHVVKRFFPPRGGDPVRMEGTCRQTMVNGGRFLQSDFVFQAGDQKTTGLGIIGFEPANGLFTSVWTDSRSTRMSLRRSREPFNGKEIVLFSGSLDTAAKSARTSRTVTRLAADGNEIVHRQYLLGRDGKERLVMELVLKRKHTSIGQ